MTDLIKDEEFIKLEKEFKFLSRARAHHGELEKLSYVVVDLETTGLNPTSDEIIEIGAIKFNGEEVKDIFNKLVKPEKQVSENIVSLTGITPEMLAAELPIKPVITQFLRFIGDAIIIAHNADFDVSFLNVNLKKWLNKELNNFVVCTLLVARDILPNLENHKLPTVAKYFGIDVSNRHRAIGDSELTYQIWLKFLDKLKDKKVITRNDLETYISNLNNPKLEKAVPF
jgi:DNA polymerase-3 subunit alpha (Gram-positive type)